MNSIHDQVIINMGLAFLNRRMARFQTSNDAAKRTVKFTN